MTTAAHQPTPKAPTKEALGERRFVAYTLRAQGMKFADIGKRMNISAGRARELYWSAEYRLTKPPHWTDGLKSVTKMRLREAILESREQVMQAFQSGRLHPLKAKCGYGWKTHEEIALWLGLQKPLRSMRKSQAPRICPHCGKAIN